ncbi:hypothetical protein K523DRAFT_369960 [Schizophyllum commune Tattone D]|nr:hypothetical protein K523DRAFT_369960 [Schizophyllum commune Tattone D]
MNEALQLPKILNLICRCLYYGDISRLSLVSTYLHSAVGPVLWESLAGLDPLLRLMPQDAWHLEDDDTSQDSSEHRYFNFSRPLRREDWLPVLAKSKFVKKLYNVDGFYGCILFRATVAQAIVEQPPPALLLPNVRRLCCYPHDHLVDESPIPYSLLSITTLELKACRFVDSKILTATCPNVDSLTIWCKCESDALGAHAALMDTLGQWPHLETVHLTLHDWTWEPNPFLALSQLESLSSLHLHQGGYFNRLQAPQFRAQSFPALRTMVLDSISLDLITAIVRSWHAPKSMEVIDLQGVFGLDSCSASVLRAIQEKCAPPYLRKVIVRPPYSSDASAEEPQLRLHHLQPLSGFWNLTEVSFRMMSAAFLTDDDHARIASWWPRLQKLDFAVEYPSEPAPASYPSLLSYARGCPDLQELSINFTAASLEEDKVTEVTIFLSMVFPHLKALRYPVSYYDEGFWEVVERCLPILQAAHAVEDQHRRSCDCLGIASK